MPIDYRNMVRHGRLLCALLLLHYPALAQGDRATSPPEFARRADNLKPGQWVWAPQVSPTGPLLVYVDLSRQIATVYRNGVRIAVSTISSGSAPFTTKEKYKQRPRTRIYET